MTKTSFEADREIRTLTFLPGEIGSSNEIIMIWDRYMLSIQSIWTPWLVFQLVIFPSLGGTSCLSRSGSLMAVTFLPYASGTTKVNLIVMKQESFLSRYASMSNLSM